MTQGNPWKLILWFSVPLMIANAFQQVYTITDSVIVSRTLGIDALAALGSADWYDYMIICIIQSAAQGFAILMAQDYGRHDQNHLKKTIAHSIYLCMIITVALTFLSILLIDPILIFLRTPSSISWMTKEYLFYKFLGLFCSMLLNYTASVLRAFGNSKTPLYSTLSSAVINIFLDLLFVNVFDFGIAGAAVATVISQGIGGFFNALALKNIPYMHIERNDFSHVEGLNRKLLLLSVPMILQNILISFGGLIVQSKVNTFDLSFIAGYTATNKLYGALELAAIAYGFAMVTYMGQNYGAKEYQRMKEGLKAGLIIAIITGAIVGIIMILCGRMVTAIFLTGSEQNVQQANHFAYQFMCILSSFLPILYVLHVLRSVLQGVGNTFVPMISGIAELIARIIFVFIITGFIGSSAVFWGEIGAWCASDLVLIYSVVKEFRGLKIHHIPSTM